MSEKQPPIPKLSFEEVRNLAWAELEKEPESSAILDTLCEKTAAALPQQSVNDIEDVTDVRERWQTTAYLISKLCARPWGYNEKPSTTDILRHGLANIPVTIES